MYGQPVPKGRPRLARNGHTYTPEKTRDAELAVMQAAFCAGIKPMAGPLLLEVNFHFQIPKSWSKKQQALAREYKVLPCSKPDIDNCLKLVMDALLDVAYLKDDSQVVGIVSRKYYSDEPHTYVCISEVEINEQADNHR